MVSESEASRFRLGLTYWPRRAGYRWWREYDRGAVREELMHVAALGCDTVRFCLTWEDFQPGAQRINSGALNALEHALDAAQAAGLRVVPMLFPVAIGGALWLPAWANGAIAIEQLAGARQLVVRTAGGPPLLADGRYQRNQAHSLFSDPQVLAGQRYLIREVVGYFGAHTALEAWQLGEGLERVRRPDTGAAVRDWFGVMADAIRERRAKARVLGVVSAYSLGLTAGPRPDQILDRCDLLGVVADPPQPPAGARANHSSFVAFLHALAAALAGRAPLVASMGLPTTPTAAPGAGPNDQPGWVADSAFGRPLRAYIGDQEQQAIFAETTLDRLQRDGAAGAWLAAYADYPVPLWHTPPLDRAIRERTLGLVDAEGREKLAAAAVQRFAAERRPVGPLAPPIEVDPERYWREPQRELARLWREFTSD